MVKGHQVRLFVLLAVAITALLIAEAAEAKFEKQTDCPESQCQLVFCVNRNIDECDAHTEIFVKRDGLCYCCDSCVKVNGEQQVRDQVDAQQEIQQQQQVEEQQNQQQPALST